MGKVKEGARRTVILLAIGGFLFSTIAVTILAVIESGKTEDTSSQQAELLKQLQEQQANQASGEPLPGYSAAAFDKAAVTSLSVETLKQGDGPAATADSTVKANYFGWTSDGTIFDSSNKTGTPEAIEFALGSVIVGWKEGLTGVKAGSVVKLTIPADKAYGATGSPPKIGANEPLQFIVEVVEVK